MVQVVGSKLVLVVGSKRVQVLARNKGRSNLLSSCRTSLRQRVSRCTRTTKLRSKRVGTCGTYSTPIAKVLSKTDFSVLPRVVRLIRNAPILVVNYLSVNDTPAITFVTNPYKPHWLGEYAYRLSRDASFCQCDVDVTVDAALCRA